MFRLTRLFLIFVFICLPNLATAEEEYWEYTFRPDDSIWKIAKKYTTTPNNWVELREINAKHLGPDHQIRPGTRIVIPVSMLKLQPAPAVVIALNGDVTLIRANGDEEKPVVGTKLFSGDSVLAKDAQSLRMQFADKSELQVLANSEVVLNKLSHHKESGMVDTRIRLNTGSINTWVEKQTPDSRYEITTPSAITAVRGTVFRLSADGNQLSRTEVTEGLVAVMAGDMEKGVKHGYGLLAEKDKPLPDPVELLPAPELSDNQFADNSELHVLWKAIEGAKKYHYQLATDEKFNKIIVDETTTGNEIKIDDLAVGQYYLLVRGVDKFTLEGFDSSRSYDISEPAPMDDSYWKGIMLVGILLLFL